MKMARKSITERGNGMQLYVTTEEDPYVHKLATILGRGKRLKRALKAFPTERCFKNSSLKEISQAIGIKNLDSKMMRQLAQLDKTYNELITVRYGTELSIQPRARRIMGIDTEYLLSPLDSIQFVITDGDSLFSGFIFTNEELARAVSPVKGVELLCQIIDTYQPDLIVGHNFNCDITVMEKVLGREIPILHQYDDTLKMARKTHVANLVGSAALKKLMKKIFSFQGLNVRTAYRNVVTFVEYGIIDAILPIYLRNFFITGEKPEFKRPKKLDYLIHSTNNIQLKYDKFQFPDG